MNGSLLPSRIARVTQSFGSLDCPSRGDSSKQSIRATFWFQHWRIDAPRVSGDTHSGTFRSPNVVADNFGPSSYLVFTQSLSHFTYPYFQPGNLPTSDMCLGSGRSHANSITQTPLQGTGTNGLATTAAFDPFVTAPAPLPGAGVGTVPGNPYSPDTAAAATAAALNGAAFFANQSGFQQPVGRYSICLPRLV